MPVSIIAVYACTVPICLPRNSGKSERTRKVLRDLEPRSQPVIFQNTPCARIDVELPRPL